jgi:hypothetical protein
MIALADCRMVTNRVRRSAVPLPKPIGLIVQDRIKILEFETSQSEKQLLLLKKSRADPTSVPFVEWHIATHRSDARKKDRHISGYMEFMRRREMGEKCDGWAFGQYFGPP